MLHQDSKFWYWQLSSPVWHPKDWLTFCFHIEPQGRLWDIDLHLKHKVESSSSSSGSSLLYTKYCHLWYHALNNSYRKQWRHHFGVHLIQCRPLIHSLSLWVSFVEKWTLLGIIHLICKAVSWIRLDESQPRSCCGSKQWVTSTDSQLHRRCLKLAESYYEGCQDYMKLQIKSMFRLAIV